MSGLLLITVLALAIGGTPAAKMIAVLYSACGAALGVMMVVPTGVADFWVALLSAVVFLITIIAGIVLCFIFSDWKKRRLVSCVH